jgi:hypothetical protein
MKLLIQFKNNICQVFYTLLELSILILLLFQISSYLDHVSVLAILLTHFRPNQRHKLRE